MTSRFERPRRAHAHPLALAAAAALAVLTSCATRPVPPAPAPRPQPAVESWVVSPAGGYEDSYGYVRLEFQPPGTPGLPAGGRLVVHLGRQGLAHANTIWYRFRVTEGAADLLDVPGGEGIPNVKGPDGNWWNDVILDLPGPFSRPLRVTVEDSRTGITYAFTVRGK
jgi:hypothetical protein